MADREKLITENFGLVHACANRFKGRGIEYDDLFQIGCVGLIKAADGFDESRGLMFSTYAVPTILGEIKRVFRDSGFIKVSRSLKELALKVYNVKEEIEKEISGEATVGDIANRLGVTAEEVTEALCVLKPCVSLTYQDEDGTNEIQLPVVGEENTINNRLFAQELMNKLTKEESNLIKLRYYQSRTQSETAKILNMSQVQVSRSEKRILAKLRSYGA